MNDAKIEPTAEDYRLALYRVGEDAKRQGNVAIGGAVWNACKLAELLALRYAEERARATTASADTPPEGK